MLCFLLWYARSSKVHTDLNLELHSLNRSHNIIFDDIADAARRYIDTCALQLTDEVPTTPKLDHFSYSFYDIPLSRDRYSLNHAAAQILFQEFSKLPNLVLRHIPTPCIVFTTMWPYIILSCRKWGCACEEKTSTYLPKVIHYSSLECFPCLDWIHHCILREELVDVLSMLRLVDHLTLAPLVTTRDHTMKVVHYLSPFRFISSDASFASLKEPSPV